MFADDGHGAWRLAITYLTFSGFEHDRWNENVRTTQNLRFCERLLKVSWAYISVLTATLQHESAPQNILLFSRVLFYSHRLDVCSFVSFKSQHHPFCRLAASRASAASLRDLSTAACLALSSAAAALACSAASRKALLEEPPGPA